MVRFQEKSLLFLHGWQDSKESWQPLKSEIEKAGFKVFLPDLPGFKKENILKKSWDLNDYREWVREFISKDIRSFGRPSKRPDGGTNQNQKIFLLGHSFGGRVAIKFANKYPEKLSGLILVSAGGVESADNIRNIKKRIFKKYSQPFKKLYFLPGYAFLRKLFYRFIIRKTDYLNLQGNLKETFKKVIDENLLPFLEKIEIPTLIIWGENDKILPLKDGQLMHQKILNSKLEVLPSVGHSPNKENPKLLAQKIINFIKSTERNEVSQESSFLLD